MPSLREIKDRIGSVRSTLKITSAMKLVASAKLRKAQRTIETLRPYEQTLNQILLELMSGGGSSRIDLDSAHSTRSDGSVPPFIEASDSNGAMEESCSRTSATAVVVISSNSSLCGAFNANVLRKAFETIRQEEEAGCAVKVFAIGRKAAETMKKAGYECENDYSDLIGHPSFDASSVLSGELIHRFEGEEFGKVLLVYNHFVTAASQSQVVEQYLPYVAPVISGEVAEPDEEYIVEPSPEEVLKSLLPQVMTLKFHAAVLDSAAAEHAARTVAMQTATDNAEDLLSELTLEYNKGRQQKITAEILDLLGGAVK